MFLLLLSSYWLCLAVLRTPYITLGHSPLPQAADSHFQQPGFESWENLVTLLLPVSRCYPETLRNCKTCSDITSRTSGKVWEVLKGLKEPSVPDNQVITFLPALGGLTKTRVHSQNRYIVTLPFPIPGQSPIRSFLLFLSTLRRLNRTCTKGVE